MQLSVSDIDVEVTRKDIKNMYLRILPPDGRVVVSAPRRMSDADIKSFVASKLPWIREKRASLLVKRQTKADNGQATLPLWGEQYPLSVREGKRFSLEIAGNEARLTVRAGASEAEREAYLREWYRAELCRETSRLLPIWEARTGLKCNEWRTKDMKTRWGTCNTRDKRIWLNVQLAKHPTRCLEYVIVHELSHLVEPSHGPAFKALMDGFMPEWRSIKKELNSGTR